MICIPDITITINLLVLLPILILLFLGLWYFISHILIFDIGD